MAIFQSILNAMFGFGEKFKAFNPVFQSVRTTMFSCVKKMIRFVIPAFYVRFISVLLGGEQTVGIVVWGFKWGTPDLDRDRVLPRA
ncbi:hypothetical protein N7493_010135 [Penicillium malachiteum]|uniref:Uncharacterized protein n=1 Tax=Penicillium malachiteum TaxID=1324776 RepID=A0AAD6MRC0_9EURO|nr:hypothetical protein N7493_010135 [Penicillium malachiteum]